MMQYPQLEHNNNHAECMEHYLGHNNKETQ